MSLAPEVSLSLVIVAAFSPQTCSLQKTLVHLLGHSVAFSGILHKRDPTVGSLLHLASSHNALGSPPAAVLSVVPLSLWGSAPSDWWMDRIQRSRQVYPGACVAATIRRYFGFLDFLNICLFI